VGALHEHFRAGSHVINGYFEGLSRADGSIEMRGQDAHTTAGGTLALLRGSLAFN